MNLPAIQTASDHPLDEEWPRWLARAAQRGSLMRIRRGCYVDAAEWAALDAGQQYRLTLRAVLSTANRTPLFAEESAAFLWGLPLPGVPSLAETIVPRGTGRRTSNGVRRIIHPAVGALQPDRGLRCDGEDPDCR